ncbi:MAG TPA: 5-(carboxyamino)imidazole ribonucleotide synthase [Actinomycetota bacterium]|nr:5-(carboxyamino)imidazole ribonucleotide synthase [Actinomycetota bacterium]
MGVLRVGIIGGGQLGRMLALAGHELGIECTTLDPAPASPAAAVAPAIVGAYDDLGALADLAAFADVITYEFENVPVEAARFAEELVPVLPPPGALEAAQDRLAEKELFTRTGLAVPAYAAVDSPESLTAALAQVGTPAVLKTRRLGYDGKGQAVIRDAVLALDAWRSLGEVPCLLEAFVEFDRELSIVAARGSDGATVAYPLVENLHGDGILRLTRAPAPDVDPATQREAQARAHAVLAELSYVGVLAIELFEVGGSLLGNEMAPRVHNSGHWTIEGAETSQFENHLRAVCGLPLGPAEPVGVSAMVNLIGVMPDAAGVMAVPGAHLHDYGKDPRPGRKLGHVTVAASGEAELESRLDEVSRLMEEP